MKNITSVPNDLTVYLLFFYASLQRIVYTQIHSIINLKK